MKWLWSRPETVLKRVDVQSKHLPLQLHILSQLSSILSEIKQQVTEEFSHHWFTAHLVFHCCSVQLFGKIVGWLWIFHGTLLEAAIFARRGSFLQNLVSKFGLGRASAVGPRWQISRSFSLLTRLACLISFNSHYQFSHHHWSDMSGGGVCLAKGSRQLCLEDKNAWAKCGQQSSRNSWKIPHNSLQVAK